jgi:hypothetical protein
VLSNIVDKRELIRPKSKVNGTCLYLDNAQPHLTSGKYRQIWDQKTTSSSRQSRPAFPWFKYLRHCLKGQFFDNDVAMEGGVSEMLMLIEPDMFVRMFAEWKHWLQQCIDHGGDYLWTDRFASSLIKLSLTRPQANGPSTHPESSSPAATIHNANHQKVYALITAEKLDFSSILSEENYQSVQIEWMPKSSSAGINSLSHRFVVLPIGEPVIQRKWQVWWNFLKFTLGINIWLWFILCRHCPKSWMSLQF